MLYRRPLASSAYYVAKPGFCHHTLTKQHFKTEFIDGKTGGVLHSYVQQRNPRKRSRFNRFRLYQNLPEVRSNYHSIVIAIHAFFIGVCELQIIWIPIPPFGKAVRPRESDLGILIMGTIGLLILLYILMVYLMTFVMRVQKYTD